MPPGRPESQPAKQALNLRLDPDVVKQLRLHSVESDRCASDIVADLVRKHLARFELVEAPVETPTLSVKAV
jgi:hypothetical protein